MNRTVSQVMQWLPGIELAALNLAIALVMLVAGWWISAAAGRSVRRMAAGSPKIDPTIVPMAYTITLWGIRVIVLIAVLARLGVQTASIIAVLGAAGLAIGLALQGTLQNIAAGIMLLVLRPLRAGENVSVVGKADGLVDEVGLFLSRFRRPDGTYITVPNSQVWGNPIINFSRNGLRRVDFQVGVCYSSNIGLAIKELEQVISTHALALKDPAPEVVVTEYGKTTAIIAIRVWTRAPDYGVVRNDLHQQGLEALKQAGLRLTPDVVVAV